MPNLIIFGAKEIAEVAHFYFSHDSPYTVKAFAVDAEFIDNSTFQGLPIIPFAEIQDHFPASDFEMFIALGYGKVNESRKQKYLEAKSLGYNLASYLSSKALHWGENPIGDNTMILESVVIQPFVSIGNNVFIWSGSHIGHHVTIKDHAFITSQVVIGGSTEIGEQCFLGINSTIRDHIKVANRSIIGAGTIIMENTSLDAIYATERTTAALVNAGVNQRVL